MCVCVRLPARELGRQYAVVLTWSHFSVLCWSVRQCCGTFCVWADGLLMRCRCSSEHEPNFCSDGSLHSYASLWIHDGARSEKGRRALNIGNYPFLCQSRVCFPSQTA